MQNFIHEEKLHFFVIFDRPGVAGAVLQTTSLLIN